MFKPIVFASFAAKGRSYSLMLSLSIAMSCFSYSSIYFLIVASSPRRAGLKVNEPYCALRYRSVASLLTQ